MSNVNRQFLLGKIETTYGTSSAPVAANAILVEDLDITPMEASGAQPNGANGTFSKEASIPYDTHVRIRFSYDLTTGTAKGVAPPYGVFLRGCAMQEVITASTSVAYNPLHTAFEGMTIFAYIGNTLHEIAGCRGTWSLSVQRGLPKLQFEFMGLFKAPTDVTPPTPVYSGQLQPAPANKANTAFTLGGAALVLHSLQLQFGNQPVYRDKPNYEAVDIDDRVIAGTIQVHQPALATFNAFARAAAATMTPLSLTHTLAPTRAAQVLAATLQVTKPAYAADGKQRLLSMAVNGTRNAGAHDAQIILT